MTTLPTHSHPNKTAPSRLKTAKSWAWTTIKYLAVFLVVYTAINWWRQPVMPANPDLQLADYQGQTLDLEALSQQSPVLVYFWGTWCPVCKVTSPTVNSLAQNSAYPVISIAVKSGNDAELSQFMKNNGYDFATVNDKEGEIFSDWQGQVTPSFVILKNGKMTQGLTGIQPEWSLKLRLWLASVL